MHGPRELSRPLAHDGPPAPHLKKWKAYELYCGARLSHVMKEEGWDVCVPFDRVPHRWLGAIGHLPRGSKERKVMLEDPDGRGRISEFGLDGLARLETEGGCRYLGLQMKHVKSFGGKCGLFFTTYMANAIYEANGSEAKSASVVTLHSGPASAGLHLPRQRADGRGQEHDHLDDRARMPGKVPRSRRLLHRAVLRAHRQHLRRPALALRLPPDGRGHAAPDSR